MRNELDCNQQCLLLAPPECRAACDNGYTTSLGSCSASDTDCADRALRFYKACTPTGGWNLVDADAARAPRLVTSSSILKNFHCPS